jgi:hypothetical protein
LRSDPADASRTDKNRLLDRREQDDDIVAANAVHVPRAS